MSETTLYEVRCPNNAWKGNTNKMICNTLCGRVNALTMGEFHCRKCKVLYNFTVNEDGTIDYFFEATPIDKIKKRFTGRMTAEDRLMQLVNGEDND